MAGNVSEWVADVYRPIINTDVTDLSYYRGNLYSKPEIGPDGKVIVPTLTYVDIGGMGDNSNKSFWTNIPGSNSFISFDLALSSYQGEMLTNYLTDYDPDLRKIVYKEISKQNLSKLEGSKGKKKLLEDIKNEFNAYFAEKELDPVVFGAHFKVLAITTRG